MRRSELRRSTPLARSTLNRRRTPRRHKSTPQPEPQVDVEALRRAVFERDRWTCRRCGKRVSWTGGSLSHLLPKSKGGVWADFCLETLCGDGVRGCHGWVEANPEAAVEAGHRIPGSVVIKGGQVTFYGVDCDRYAEFRQALRDFAAGRRPPFASSAS